MLLPQTPLFYVIYPTEKTSKLPQKPPTSAFSTGGGGVDFEHVVGGYFSSHLIVGTSPPGANDFALISIAWQRREIDDEPLDDLILGLDAPHSPNGTAYLSLQLKHDMAWGDSQNNATFRAVMRAAWDTFLDPKRGQFDRHGVAVGVDKVDFRTYKEVIQIAEDCQSGRDFVRVVGKAGARQKNFVALMRGVLNSFVQADAPGSSLSDDQLWEFLRRFCLLRFDLLESNSKDKALCCASLQTGLGLSNPSRAREVWNEMIGIVSRSDRNAGSLNKNTLEEKLARYLPRKKAPVETIVQTPSAIPVTMEALSALFDSRLGSQTAALGALVKGVDDRPEPSQQRIEEERIDAKVDVARELIQKGHARAARETLNAINSDDSLPPRLQFRVKANLGVCASVLDDNTLAAQLCRAAYLADKDNPKAMIIGAQAEMLDENFDHALQLCEAALKSEPKFAEAASIYAGVLLETERYAELRSWAERESWVWEEAKCSPHLARLEWHEGRINKAIEQLERFQKEANPEEEVTSTLAWLLLTRPYEKWRKKPTLSWNLPHQMKRDLARSADLYQNVITNRNGFDDRRQSALCLTNRAVSLMLLNRDAEANSDLQQAARITPDSPTIWINIGWLHLKIQEFEESFVAHEKAHALFEQEGVNDKRELGEEGLRWENTRGFALALYQTDRWDKLRSHLASFIRWDGQALVDAAGVPLDAQALTYDLCDLLGLWLQAQDSAAPQGQGRLSRVQEEFSPLQQDVWNWLEQGFPDHPELLTLRGDFLWFKRRFREAIHLMRRAAELCPQEYQDRAKLVLAESLFYMRRYRACVPLFKATVSEFAVNPHLEHYALALLRSGHLEEARRIAAHVRGLGRKAGEKQGQAVPLFSEIEAECAHFVGDLDLALWLRRGLMEREPGRKDYALEVALLELEKGNRQGAQAVLGATSLPHPEQLPELALRFAHVKVELRLPGALELGFQVWRAFPHSSNLQVSYMALFQSVTSENDPLLSPEVVGPDCAVTLRTVGSKQPARTRLFLQRPDAPVLTESEGDLSLPQWQQLVGKRVGDMVTIGHQLGDDVEVEITEIRHKFVYAFQETIHRLERGDIQHEGFGVGNIEDEGGIEVWRQKVTKMLLQSRKSWELLADYYRRYPVPLSTVALVKERFPLELWNDIASAGGRFYSSKAGPEQIHRDAQALLGQQELVLDVTALGCICLLGVEAQVKKRFSRLLVPRLVRQELMLQLGREERSGASSGHLTHDGLGLRYIEARPEAYKEKKDFIERVLRFVDRDCEVVPVPSLLRHPKWVTGVGKGAIASVLLAQERRVPLWSDDARIRRLAAEEFGVPSTYFFPVLWHLRATGWAGDAFLESLCRLTLHGYTYIWLPADLLIWRLRRDDLKLTPETRALLFYVFNGYDVEMEWAARELAFFIERLWNQSPRLLESQFRPILHAALEGYVHKRSTATALQELQKSLAGFLRFDHFSLRLLSTDIDRWQKDQLRVIDRGSRLEIGRLQVASLHESLIVGHPDQR